MDSGRNFDYKSDFDFPSLSNASSVNSRSPTSPPDQPKEKNEGTNTDVHGEARSMSRGRGKKKGNWVPFQVDFGNTHSQRIQSRGSSRGKFGGNHAVTKPAEDIPDSRASRNGGRSRSRRARGGPAIYNERLQTEDHTITPLTALPSVESSPTMIPIPYTSNYTTFVQSHVAGPSIEVPPLDIKQAIRRQIEYYFSEENLVSDGYMRTHMTKEGFLSIELISNFKKIQEMKVDIETITEAIEASDKLDVVDRRIVRPVVNPLRWPILPGSTKFAPVGAKLAAAPIVPVEDVFQNIQPVIPDSSKMLTNFMGNLSLNAETAYGYDQYYPTDSQNGNRYRHMVTLI